MVMVSGLVVGCGQQGLLEPLDVVILMVCGQTWVC